MLLFSAVCTDPSSTRWRYLAADMFGQVYADKAFRAPTARTGGGLTTPSMAVAAIELAMIRRTRGGVVLPTPDMVRAGRPPGHLPARPERVVLVDSRIDTEMVKQIHVPGTMRVSGGPCRGRGKGGRYVEHLTRWR